jgi:hypothetical protein
MANFFDLVLLPHESSEFDYSFFLVEQSFCDYIVSLGDDKEEFYSSRQNPIKGLCEGNRKDLYEREYDYEFLFASINIMMLDESMRGNGKYLSELFSFYVSYSDGGDLPVFIYCDDCNNNSSRLFEYYYKNDYQKIKLINRGNPLDYAYNIPMSNIGAFQNMISKGIEYQPYFNLTMMRYLDAFSSVAFSAAYSASK